MNIYEYLIIYRVIILHIDAYGYEFDFVDYDFQKISEIEENHIDLLQHPVNESFMIQKWSEIRQRLKKNSIVYFGFVLCLTVMVQSNYWQLPNSKKFLIYPLDKRKTKKPNQLIFCKHLYFSQFFFKKSQNNNITFYEKFKK